MLGQSSGVNLNCLQHDPMLNATIILAAVLFAVSDKHCSSPPSLPINPSLTDRRLFQEHYCKFSAEEVSSAVYEQYLHVHLHGLRQWYVHNLQPKIMSCFIKCCMNTHWNQSEKRNVNTSTQGMFRFNLNTCPGISQNSYSRHFYTLALTDRG